MYCHKLSSPETACRGSRVTGLFLVEASISIKYRFHCQDIELLNVYSCRQGVSFNTRVKLSSEPKEIKPFDESDLYLYDREARTPAT